MTAASTAALAVGVTEMMYLPFAPKSIAVAGTMVLPSEKIVSEITIAKRNLVAALRRILTSWDSRNFSQ